MPLLQDQSARLLNYVLDGKTKLFEQGFKVLKRQLG
jgi:hypothetical protein